MENIDTKGDDELAYVYRYTDLKDNIIKYVGIVWSDNRSLVERLIEHEKNDEWCKNGSYKIEYITENIITRTDAEYFESHFVSLYGTDNYYNKSKAGWGVSSFLPDRENDWIEFDQSVFEEKCNDICGTKNVYKMMFDLSKAKIHCEKLLFTYSKCKRKKIDDSRHCKICGGNDFYIKIENGKKQMYCSHCNKKTTILSNYQKYCYDEKYIGGYIFDGNQIEQYDFYVYKGKHFGEEVDFVNKINEENSKITIYGFDKEYIKILLKRYLINKSEDTEKRIQSYKTKILEEIEKSHAINCALSNNEFVFI